MFFLKNNIFLLCVWLGVLLAFSLELKLEFVNLENKRAAAKTLDFMGELKKLWLEIHMDLMGLLMDFFGGIPICWMMKITILMRVVLTWTLKIYSRCFISISKTLLWLEVLLTWSKFWITFSSIFYFNFGLYSQIW